jgi:LPS export ABC transporter protein LptC
VISRQTRRGILLVALLAVFSWIISRPAGDSEPDRVAGLDTRLNYALYEFNGRLLDDTGNIKLEIDSPLLRNDAGTGIGTVDRPHIRIQQEQEQWYITADSAIVSADREQVTLEGTVNLVRSNTATDDRLEIVTRDVLLNVTPRTASTRAAVTIEHAGDWLAAEGMNLDMVNERYELLDDVQARYETR